MISEFCSKLFIQETLRIQTLLYYPHHPYPLNMLEQLCRWLHRPFCELTYLRLKDAIISKLTQYSKSSTCRSARGTRECTQLVRRTRAHTRYKSSFERQNSCSPGNLGQIVQRWNREPVSSRRSRKIQTKWVQIFSPRQYHFKEGLSGLFSSCLESKCTLSVKWGKLCLWECSYISLFNSDLWR